MTFANLSPFVGQFRIAPIDAKWKSRNKYFVFEYVNGKINRVAVDRSQIFRDEFMYVHFLKREMDIEVLNNDDKWLVVPNKIIKHHDIDIKDIQSLNAPHYIKFVVHHFKENSYKLNYRTIFPILFSKIKGYYRLFFNYSKISY